MPSKPWCRIPLGVAICTVFLLSVEPMSAGASHSYDKTGTVISTAHNPGFVYEIESQDSLYTMDCSRTKLIQFRPPECEWNGHPIAVGDVVRFRIEGDGAFIPTGADSEERLIILMTETKLLPQLPAVPAGFEGAVVLGLGVAPAPAGPKDTQSFAPLAAPSAAPSASSDSMTPVVATPTTGGPPVVVIPTAPATGPVITGVPAAGGAPITAIPVAPTANSSSLDAPAANSSPLNAGPDVQQWVHVLRVQTASYVYDLSCSRGACRLSGKLVQTGDPLALRIDKKWAYVSQAGIRHEQRFAILSVRDIDSPTSELP